MTDLAHALDRAPATAPSSRLPRRPTVRVTLAAAVVLGLVVASLLWWSRPTALQEASNEVGYNLERAELGPVSFAMMSGSGDGSETVTVTSASPRVVENTANATVTVVLCTVRSEAYAAVRGAAEEMCESVTALDGREVRLETSGSTTISMTVLPRQPGRVVVEGVDVSYTRSARHLWQSGTQTVGPVATVVVR